MTNVQRAPVLCSAYFILLSFFHIQVITIHCGMVLYIYICISNALAFFYLVLLLNESFRSVSC